MDTKSKKDKKLHPVLAWVSFFLSVNILVVFLLFAASYALEENVRSSVRDALQSDYQKTDRFARYLNSLTIDLSGALTNPSDIFAEQTSSAAVAGYDGEYYFTISSSSALQYYAEDSENMIYYAEDNISGLSLTNAKQFEENLREGNLPEGFQFWFHFHGGEISAVKDGKPFDVDNKRYLEKFAYFLSDQAKASFPGIENIDIWVAVSSSPKYSNSYYVDYSNYLFSARRVFDEVQAYRYTAIALTGLFLLALILLAVSIRFHAGKKHADQRIAGCTKHLWFDTKIIILLLLSTITLSSSVSEISTFIDIVCVFGIFWALYLFINDLRYNPKIYRHNLFHTLSVSWRRYEMTKPFQKQMMARYYALLLWETALILLSFIVPLMIVTIPALIYINFRYSKKLGATVNDMGKLIDQISEVKSGNLTQPLILPADTDMNAAAQNLNNIQSGINKAVEEQVKSERMKIELITNVSHDIKTPLTSIIGYVDLLKQEDGLPDYVKDYINVLALKSERLKNMVQDIFDVSKAASGNIDLNLAVLDLGKLIEQTLADMNEEISSSKLVFKTEIPEKPVYINADGRRMYRVFQNLIKNALQYSLEGSRVFVSLQVTDGKAVAELKNVSKYEIDVEKTDVTERFVRGDASRSTEGSGLGLSIVKSFTNACGGEFSVSVDADLFCAKIVFSVVPDIWIPKDEETLAEIQELGRQISPEENDNKEETPGFPDA